MPTYVREFVVERVADAHLAFHQALTLAESVERTYARIPGRGAAAAATLRQLRVAYARFNDDLTAVARETARDAQRFMREELDASKRRPGTGAKGGRHLKGALVARPEFPVGKLATGVVGIADVERLDAVVNPLGPQYGPYWRTQEYGSTAHVGREVYGFFTRSGYGEPFSKPDSARAGRDPIFVPGRTLHQLGARAGSGPSSQGGLGGKLTIRNPIRPRHFIRAGANAARAEWLRGIAEAEQRAIARMNRALGL